MKNSGRSWQFSRPYRKNDYIRCGFIGFPHGRNDALPIRPDGYGQHYHYDYYTKEEERKKNGAAVASCWVMIRIVAIRSVHGNFWDDEHLPCRTTHPRVAKRVLISFFSFLSMCAVLLGPISATQCAGARVVEEIENGDWAWFDFVTLARLGKGYSVRETWGSPRANYCNKSSSRQLFTPSSARKPSSGGLLSLLSGDLFKRIYMYRRMSCWTLVREPRLLFPILRLSLEEGSVPYKVTASSFTLLEVNPYNSFCKLVEKN